MGREDLGRWLDGYRTAWESRDPDAAVRLFTEDVRYHETPFDPPATGSEAVRAYWADATGTQRDVRVRYQILAVTEHGGLARWWADFVRVANGARVSLEGILMLDFAEDGRCRELREWWHEKETMPEG